MWGTGHGRCMALVRTPMWECSTGGREGGRQGREEREVWSWAVLAVGGAVAGGRPQAAESKRVTRAQRGGSVLYIRSFFEARLHTRHTNGAAPPSRSLGPLGHMRP